MSNIHILCFSTSCTVHCMQFAYHGDEGGGGGDLMHTNKSKGFCISREKLRACQSRRRLTGSGFFKQSMGDIGTEEE